MNNNINFVSEYDLDLDHLNEINNLDARTESRHMVESISTSHQAGKNNQIRDEGELSPEQLIHRHQAGAAD